MSNGYKAALARFERAVRAQEMVGAQPPEDRPGIESELEEARRALVGKLRYRQLAAEARQYPTEDAYLAACRATHWRDAQLRAHGIEPIRIPTDAPQYPPDDFDFAAAE